MMKTNDPVVLIVDDDKYIRESIKELLASWAFRYDEAEDGAGALAKLKTKIYSLVLLDMKMDNKNGLEVLKELKVLKIKVPVLLITAFPLDECVKEAMEYDVYCCLNKPFSPKMLKEAITNVLYKGDEEDGQDKKKDHQN